MNTSEMASDPEDKRERLKALLRDRSSTPRVAPTSFGQQRLWFLEQLMPGSAVFNLPAGLRIRGRISVAKVAAILDTLLARHDTLRTSIASVGGEPKQIIAPKARLKIPVIDLRSLSAAERESEAQRVMVCAAREPFEPSRGPLIRVKIIRLSDNEHVAFFNVSHLVFDGWSLRVLLREVLTLYLGHATGRPIQLPPLQHQFGDFAAWQRKILAGEKLQRQLGYWKDQLKGLSAFEIPTDRPRPAVRSFRGAIKSFAIPEALLSAVRRFARAENTTPFVVFLTAFKLLLHRYSRQFDIAVGSPVAGRNRREDEDLIGLFVNTLVLRTCLSGDPTARQLVARVRSTTLAALENQDVPFERLVDEIETKRSLSRDPLSQVSFGVVPSLALDINQVAGISIETLEIDPGVSQQELSLLMFETADGFTGRFEYNTDLFEPSTIERMSGHYLALLTAIVNQPEERVSLLSMLSAEERRQLTDEWNDTQVDYARPARLNELFEAQVEETPNAIAVTFGESSLTYEELNRRSNQLARYLTSRGLKADQTVGLIMHRSLEMVIGLMGVLKAGGAYLPIDPDYPIRRQKWMIEDAGLQCILASGLPRGLPVSVPIVDMGALQLGNLPDKNRANGSRDDGLAYVIYTSGSTGTPKGAMISHRSICNRLLWMQSQYQLEADDRVLQKTPYCFDVSVWEFFWPLISGATLVMARPDGHRDPGYLVETIQNERITTIHFVPSMLEAFLQAEGVENCRSLRRVICSGEALPTKLVRKAFQRLDAPLFNLYGPTEAAVDVTAWSCRRFGLADSIPIGRPVANTHTYILDRQLQLVPIGVPGELFLGGIQLARGYLRRQGLTAEKFMPDAYSSVPGSRMYRTGDLCRYLPNGDIEFLGRLDHQVKVRGFRIELGEIETALRHHSNIHETVVMAQYNGAATPKLVGYFVANGERPSTDQLRQFLGERLPDYMVPSYFVPLESFPLTHNGKLDRAALPKVESSHVISKDRYVAPRNDVESQLAGIWQDVLGLERIGVEDNFFEIGGDSILSIQVVSRARKAHLQLTPQQLFQHQSIAELARVVGTTPAIAVDQGPVSGQLPPAPISQWFFAQELPEPHHYNQAVLLEIDDEVDKRALELSLQHLVVHHDALRLQLSRQQSGWEAHNAGINGIAEKVLLQIFDLRAQTLAEQKASLSNQAATIHRNMDLSEGCLLRAGLFERGHSNWLLLVAHHLAVDGVSWRILLEDLFTAYELGRRQQPITLPEKTTSYKAWCEQLAQLAQSEKVGEHADYWREVVGNCNCFSVPRDNSHGLNDNHAAETLLLSLDSEHTKALMGEANSAYRTHAEDLLLTALAKCLADWSESNSVAVHLENHGREASFAKDVDLSRTVGWFTSLYPVHLRLDDAQWPGNAIRSVKDQLARIPDNGLSYGVLRYLSSNEQLKRDLQSTAAVCFNYLGQIDQLLPKAGPVRISDISPGPLQAAAQRRPHLIDFTCVVKDGQLHVAVTYSSNYHSAPTIRRVAEAYVEALRDVISHCLDAEAGGYSPADFPAADLDQKRINLLRTKYKRIDDIYPLTPTQLGMLYYSLAVPSSGLYLQQVVSTVSGRLDPVAFGAAIEELVAAHPVLRTSFVVDGLKEPLQLVHPQVPLPFEQQDWQQDSAEQQAERLRSLIEHEQKLGFDLSQAPLIRIKAICLGEDEWRIVWTQHHIILDGWSMPLLLKDLMTRYESRRLEITLPPTRNAPFRDFVVHTRSQDAAASEQFWRSYFKGFTSPTPLPGDSHRFALNGHANSSKDLPRQDTQEWRLGRDLTTELQTLLRDHRLTMNTLLQGAWSLVLSTYANTDDVLFGTTVSGRSAPIEGVETIIGSLINVLPFRVRVKRSKAFLDWLQEIQSQHVRVRDYEHSPLTQIQSWSEISSNRQLFDSVLTVENYPIDESLRQRVGNLVFTDVRDIMRSNYPLVILASVDHQLTLRLRYDEVRFSSASILALLESLGTVLERLIEEPSVRPEALAQEIVAIENRHQEIVRSEHQRANLAKFRTTKPSVVTLRQNESLTAQNRIL
jgi:amino acid adenylation domain-containing protein/non-ribosomal peptide synthase protein (TIGR01720 family)